MKKTASFLFLLGSAALLSVAVVDGQEPQATHPWLTECIQYGCPSPSSGTGYFCNHDTDTCKTCPTHNEITEEDCMNVLDIDNSNNNNNNDATNSSLEDCLTNCVRPQEGDLCSNENPCAEGEFFCNYHDDTMTGGTCVQCKNDISECRFDASIVNDFGIEDCFLSCEREACFPLHFSVTTVGGETVRSNAMRGSPSLVASGPLISCTNLIHDGETTCDDVDNATTIEGAVCLVNDFTRNTYYIDVAHKCTALGGVAAIFYGDYSDGGTPNNGTWVGSLSFMESSIPSASIPYDDGNRFEQNMIGTIAEVSVSDVGDTCFRAHFCSEDIPCLGTSAGQYCDFKWGDDAGFCRECPEDPLSCFFSNEEDEGKIMRQQGVEDCAAVCTKSLTFPKCKLCPEDVSGFNFGLDSLSADVERCEFCPENDVQYPNQEFSLFGEGIKCWQVQKFFQNVDVSADAPNCKLAQAANYMCGCKGPGYAGASTDAKKKALVWLPRVMAILSLLSSSFIIFDSTKSKQRREKLLYQLLIGLSAFDILGSCAYMLTTLPVPEDDLFRVFGARGHDGTCSAQGFFIQVGTVSAYMNVAVAIYYLLVIKYGWSDNQVKKIRWALFISPIIVGLAFAFAGIPYYDNMILWCNNNAEYWPEIPVIVAIVSATAIMIAVCWDVNQKEKVSKKWRGGTGAGARHDGRTSLSTRVFWQSIWYLMAFYLTWPAYLALQFSWANGTSFTRYGFVLTAATMVPLQGFWIMLVYARPRYFKQTFNTISRSITTTFQSTSRVSSSNVIRRMSIFNRQNKRSEATATSGGTTSNPLPPPDNASSLPQTGRQSRRMTYPRI